MNREVGPGSHSPSHSSPVDIFFLCVYVCASASMGARVCVCSFLRECECRYVRVCMCVCVCVGRESLLKCFDAKVVYARKNVPPTPTSLFDMGRQPSSINLSFIRLFVLLFVCSFFCSFILLLSLISHRVSVDVKRHERRRRQIRARELCEQRSGPGLSLPVSFFPCPSSAVGFLWM